MHDPIEANAWISVARGCGFAGLATLCGMVGLSYDPPQALKFGGFCALITSSILLLKAWRASQVRYSKTETWLMLEEDQRPPPSIAQTIVASARRRTLYRFASLTANMALYMLVGSLILRALTRA
jgi:hypothetical protein